jgi:N-acetyl-anhydromuramyl-L-alanine amidase AmpD
MALALLVPSRTLNSKNCYPARPVGARRGIMLHFDDSSEDKWAVQWFTDPACKVSYNRLYLDDGSVVQITPSIESAAWHAGVCKTQNANRAYYGLAAATNAKVPVTDKQFESIAHDCAALFHLNGWRAGDVTWRVVGHEDEACFANGKLGRKADPTGLDKSAPILSTDAVRERVVELLSHG